MKPQRKWTIMVQFRWHNYFRVPIHRFSPAKGRPYITLGLEHKKTDLKTITIKTAPMGISYQLTISFSLNSMEEYKKAALSWDILPIEETQHSNMYIYTRTCTAVDRLIVYTIAERLCAFWGSVISFIFMSRQQSPLLKWKQWTICALKWIPKCGGITKKSMGDRRIAVVGMNNRAVFFLWSRSQSQSQWFWSRHCENWQHTSICVNMSPYLSPACGKASKLHRINFFKKNGSNGPNWLTASISWVSLAVHCNHVHFLVVFTQNLNLDQLAQYAQTEMNLTSFRLAENFVPDLQIPAHAHRLDYITLFDSLLTMYHGIRSYYYQKGSCHWLGEDAIYTSIQRVTGASSIKSSVILLWLKAFSQFGETASEHEEEKKLQEILKKRTSGFLEESADNGNKKD